MWIVRAKVLWTFLALSEAKSLLFVKFYAFLLVLFPNAWDYMTSARMLNDTTILEQLLLFWVNDSLEFSCGNPGTAGRWNLHAHSGEWEMFLHCEQPQDGRKNLQACSREWERWSSVENIPMMVVRISRHVAGNEREDPLFWIALGQALESPGT
jgi:hypothetical protein